MINIQARVNDLMSKKNITPSDIAKKSNLALTSVTSILNGSSKNPTAKTLKAIADVFDITLEQMLSDDIVNLEYLTIDQLTLYKQSCNNLIDTVIKKNYMLSIGKISNLIKEIYEYSLDIKSDNINERMIDKKFIDWLLKKNAQKSL